MNDTVLASKMSTVGYIDFKKVVIAVIVFEHSIGTA